MSRNASVTTYRVQYANPSPSFVVAGSKRPHRSPEEDRNLEEDTDSQRTTVLSGYRRTYTAGSHPGRTDVQLSQDTCPYSKEVEESRRHDLLEVLEDRRCQAAVFSDFILESNWALSQEEIEHKVKQLFEPINCSVDYVVNVLVIQDCLSLQNIVDNLVQHYIGRYLLKLHQLSSLTRSGVHRELGNAAEELKSHEYARLRDRCAQNGCTSCSEAKAWDEADQSSRAATRKLPCISTQVLSKLLSPKFVNLCPAFFSQCVQFSESVPVRCPLMFSSEPPTVLRLIAAKYAQKLNADIKAHGPALSTGVCSIFQVPSAIDVVQYKDGDGGTIDCEQIPHLMDYIEKKGWNDLLQGSLIPFREANHDAIELGHSYRVEELSGDQMPASRRREFGYLALVQARKNLALSVETLVVPLERDLRGGRLVVEIFTRQSDDEKPHGEETGVRLIKAGLSFPTEEAPTHCKAALLEAKNAEAGVWEFGQAMDDPRLKPWALKRVLTLPGNFYEVEIEDGDEHLEVHIDNENRHLNEANIIIGESTIPGAQRGLFLRPGRFRIPKGNTICSYQEKPDEVDESQTFDYLFEVEGHGGRPVYYQAATYDGQNIGRYINQGGLQEGLAEMCLQSDVKTGHTSFSQKTVNETFAEHCNVAYKQVRLELQVRASRDLQAHPTQPTELFGNYGPMYWIKYVAQHYRELNHEEFLAKSVLWCLLSDDSCWTQQEREPGLTIPDDVRAKFKNKSCPYKPSSLRRR